MTKGDHNPSLSESVPSEILNPSKAEATMPESGKAIGEIAPNGKGRAGNRKMRSLAERITLAVCAITLAAIVGLVLYDWQLSKNLPPAFQVEVTETTRLTAGRYYVPFTLRNTGGRIARTVQVLAELQLPDGNEETGEQQFDFLSGNERKKGGFVFEHNPKEGELIVRVASFGLP